MVRIRNSIYKNNIFYTYWSFYKHFPVASSILLLHVVKGRGCTIMLSVLCVMKSHISYEESWNCTIRKEKEIYLARVRFRELTNVESKLYADRIQYTSSYLNNADKAASLLRSILQNISCLFCRMSFYDDV